MKKIDKYLLEHIDVNRRIIFGEKSLNRRMVFGESLLNEKHGYDKDTVSFVLNSIKPAIEASTEFQDFAIGKTKNATVLLTTDEIGKTRWISSISIKINWIFDKIQDIGGGYPAGYAKIEEDGLSFSIDINVYGYNAYEMLNRVIATLSHELLHAYEDYQRKANRKPDLNDTFMKTPYPAINSLLHNPIVSDPQKVLLEVLYFLNPEERNANLSTLYTELKTTCLLLSRENVLAAIQKTSYYKEYNRYKTLLMILFYFRTDKKFSAQMLSTYNFAIEIMGQNGVNLPQMKTYKQLLKFVLVQWRKYDRKWKQNVNKVVYDILDDFCVIR